MNTKGLMILMLFLVLGCNQRKSSPPVSQNPQAVGQIPADPATLLLPAAEQSPIYVAIGGWNSCLDEARIPQQTNPYGMNMYKKFGVFIQQVQAKQPQTPVKFVIACHGPLVNTVKFVLSTSPQTLQIESHESMYQAITQFAQQSQSPVILFGHSYGGDYVMRAAQSIPTTVRVPYLVTIDPISPVSCPIPTFVKLITNRISQIIGKPFGMDPTEGLGCQQAPREFSTQQKQAIRQRVQWWQNYYQSDLLSFLKSDSIPEACNQVVRHSSLPSAVNGHIAMGMYDSLWNDIATKMMQPIPSVCPTTPI